MHRQDEHPGVRAASGNLFQRTHAAGPRHCQIQQRHVWSGVAGCLNGPISISSFRNHFHIGLSIDQHLQPRAENRVIVCDQDPDFLHCRHSWRLFGPYSDFGSRSSSGSCTRIVVPVDPDVTLTVPPSMAALSRMLCSPRCASALTLAGSTSKPEPLSSIVVSNFWDERARRMLIAVAPECLATFVSASWRIRN